jgi:Holliday junction resolvase-like predicted endonuclease
MLMITKSNGEREAFNPNKLKRSLRRSGASRQITEAIVDQVRENIKNNESTSEIYKRAFKMLKKEKSGVAAERYSLKKAIIELGPTGYPFEYFVAKLFEVQGYNVQVGKYLNGLCVRHEVDVVASKGDEKVLVEAKFRNIPGDSVGIRTPLYIKSRFEDILSKKNKNKLKDVRFMIFTNARFSRDAVRYSRCSGVLNLVGWRYPRGKGLEKIIEKSGLHPITVLNVLSRKEKRMLFERGIVVCQDINKSPNKLRKIGLSKNKTEKVIEKSRKLCGL